MRMATMALMGPLFVLVGYGLILGIAFVHFTKFLPSNSPIHLLLSIFLASQLLMQYSLAIWSDPGYLWNRGIWSSVTAMQMDSDSASLVIRGSRIRLTTVDNVVDACTKWTIIVPGSIIVLATITIDTSGCC